MLLGGIKMDSSVIVTIASVIAAWVAALFAYGSFRVAKRQTQIAEDADRRRHPHLALYLANGSVEADPDRRMYGFVLSISNRSEAENSLFRIELEVVLREGESLPLTTLRFVHDASLLLDKVPPEDVLKLPLSLRPHEVKSGWLAFLVPQTLISDAEIVRHVIVTADASGSETTLDVGTPSQVFHD
jgi:hypothetical protein